MSNTAPWGSWVSPITAEIITSKSMRLSQVRVDGGDTYWVEARSAQGGRNVLLRRSPDGTVMDILPMTEDYELIDVRSRVHEYGGKAYAVFDGVIVVSHAGNGCLYRFDPETSRLRRLTPKVEYRYGDIEFDPVRGLIYAVCEDHTQPDAIVNSLVTIPIDGSAARDLNEIKTVWKGTDFVAGTAISPDGRYLAFTTWNQPEMAWTRSQLRIAELDFEGSFARIYTLVDEPGVSCTQPRWTLTGDLIHVDDSSGWSNLYRTEGFLQEHDPEGVDWTERLRTRSLHPSAKAFSMAAWQLGLHSYDNLDNEHLICTWYENGTAHLGTVRLDNGQLEEWNTGWRPLGNVACADHRIVMLANSPTQPAAIVEICDDSVALLRSSSNVDFSEEWVSVPESITWEASDGRTVQGFYYAPKNLWVKELPEGLPPLIILAHGGPTAAASDGFNLKHQYWTTRGFAVVDVNYRGSTGFGRSYRDALNGNWGVADVNDCRGAIAALAGRIDPNRVAISGGSAGGYTALQAARDGAFSAATSYYGISDLRELATHTHKFEAEYMSLLLGSTNMEDPIWDERSPLHNVTEIKCPVLLLQGGKDAVVPPEQAQLLYDRMRARGLESELIIFPDEGHGFQRQQSIVAAMLAELAFYRRVWDLPLPASTQPDSES